MQNENEKTTEEEYRLLAEESKEKFDELQKEIDKRNLFIVDCLKLIMSTYGAVRLADRVGNVMQVKMIMQMLRSDLSDFIESGMLSHFTKEEDDDENNDNLINLVDAFILDND